MTMKKEIIKKMYSSFEEAAMHIEGVVGRFIAISQLR